MGMGGPPAGSQHAVGQGSVGTKRRGVCNWGLQPQGLSPEGVAMAKEPAGRDMKRMRGRPSLLSAGKERSHHHSITSRCVASGLSGDLRLLCPGNRGAQGGCRGLILAQ